MALSQIIRFVLPPSKASGFSKLRELTSTKYGAKRQYYGDAFAPQASAISVKKDEVCWVIEWPRASDGHREALFTEQLAGLAGDTEIKSLLFEFEDTQIPELVKALESPVCEFATINLLSTAPISDSDFRHSMHKTYTDCYAAKGFTGGSWAYAINTNDTDALMAETVNGKHIEEKDRRLACYPLGWESVEDHHAYSKTPLFFEEINKLQPWFGPGTGAWYVSFKSQQTAP